VKTEEELREREKKFTPDVIDEIVHLFIEVGMDAAEAKEFFKESVWLFLKKESNWLNIEVLLIAIKTLSLEERKE